MGVYRCCTMQKQSYNFCKLKTLLILPFFFPFISGKPSRCLLSIVRCCDAGLSILPFRCFEVNGCPGIYWHGKKTCGGSTVSRAISALNIYQDSDAMNAGEEEADGFKPFPGLEDSTELIIAVSDEPSLRLPLMINGSKVQVIFDKPSVLAKELIDNFVILDTRRGIKPLMHPEQIGLLFGRLETLTETT